MCEEPGKVDRAFFETHIAPTLQPTHESTAVGPGFGLDFGVIDPGSQRIVIAADPLSVYPALGFERAGRLALHSVLSDVAVSGLSPTHLAVNLALPESMSTDEFGALWGGITDECDALGVDIVTGHTGRTTGTYPDVGGAVALGIGPRSEIVRPDGAQPGETVLLTKGPAWEVAGLVATLFPDAFDVESRRLERAQSRLDETTLVRDAVTAAAAGPVSAMHDATECGVQGALVEMATTAGVRFELTTDSIPDQPAVETICQHLQLDPWMVSSRGTLLITVPESGVDSVVTALKRRDTPVAKIGTVRSGAGVVLDGEEVTHPRSDPAWQAFQRLQNTSQ
ncbi:AIR synthase-related protein [Natrialbaceae archaeon A-arb3/5]